MLRNPGGESSSLESWIQGPIGGAIVDNGSRQSGYSPHSGTNHFNGGNNGPISLSTLTQTVKVLYGMQCFTEAELDSGTLHTFIKFDERSYIADSPRDTARVSLIFRTLEGVLLSTESTSRFSCDGWCNQSFNYTLPIGTRLVDYIMIFEKSHGNSIDAYIDDNSLQISSG